MDVDISRIDRRHKGFTLIELLVVVSIISLLSSVTLSSLNTARRKAEDARSLQTISQVRTQFNLILESYPSGYNGFCGDTRISGFLSAMSGTCFADASGWAVYAPLKRPPAGATGICIDDKGNTTYRQPICGSTCVGVCGPI